MTEPNPERLRKAAAKLDALITAAGSPILSRTGTILRADAGTDTSRRVGTDVPPAIGALIAATAGNPALLDVLRDQLLSTANSLESWGTKVGRYSVDPDGLVHSLADTILSPRNGAPA